MGEGEDHGHYCAFIRARGITDWSINEPVLKKAKEKSALSFMDKLIVSIFIGVVLFIISMIVFSYLLIFKYLTYADLHGIKAKIILTKLDKYNDEAKIKEIIDVFTKLNIGVYVISNKTNEGLEEVKKLFANEITCLIGQTGVGKSSLINSIDPEFNRNIGSYSQALGRGKHETKEVVLLPYEGGYIADTPGFSSLDLELFKEEIAQYFPGFSSRFTECYFSNCLHLSEKTCKVKEAIETGEIPSIAYECYLKLSNEAIYKSQRYES